MTNTLENKAKFFALYWGQPVMWCMGGDDYERLKYIVRSGNMRLVEKSWLELTPLSQISDEDLEYIRPLVGYSNSFDGIGLVKRWLTNLWMDADEVNYFATTDSKPVLRTLLITDYLRSRGYALPWMGLSVETLVEYGWVKLKGGNNG